MKKKILFMLINMNVGGTEKALLNMISEIPTEKYEITIYMLEKYGGFLNFFPEGVRLEYFKDYKSIKGTLNNPPHLTALDLLKRGKIVKSLKLICLHLISKVKGERSIFYKSILKSYPLIDEEYDIAVAYDGPMDFVSYFILHKVKAKKRVQWIHFDITKIGFNSKFASKIYKEFDRVFVVSEEANKQLIKRVPTIKGKTEVFLNIISPHLITNQLSDNDSFNDGFVGLRILTVGRLSEEKGQDLAIRVLAKLIKEGYKVKWYCLGEGKYQGKLQKLVEEFNLQESFVFLGADPNPYPYIEQCDIYVQPSRHEGYCISLAEARCLKKPIVTTKTAGAIGQIRNGETGIIVEINVTAIFTAVKTLVNNKDIRERISNNLKKEVYYSSFEIRKLLNL